MKRFFPLSLVLAGLPAVAADKVTYEDQVLPIFRNACLNCHNPDKKKAGLDLSTYQAALQGSENGKVLDSGNPSGSLLYKCVKQTEDPKMPPKGEKLSDAELAIVEKWIAGQLLENANGKAVAAASNKVSVAVVSLEKPAGPPPMPGELPLEPILRTRSNNALTALAASPWAPLVAVGGQKQILLYHTETLEPLGVLPFPEGFPTIVRFSRNGQILLTGGGLGGKSGKVVLWDIKTGDRIATLGNEFDQVLGADLSPDQQFVALGGPTKLVKIYSTKDGHLVTSIKKHTDWVTAIAFSPDGKFLASADRNGGIQVWEGATGKEFNSLPGHKAMVTGLAFMPGVLASSSEDGKVALWDVKEGKEIRSWAAHPGGAAWVDFTTDGRLISCGRDKIAKAWDQNGKQLGASQPFNDIALRAALAGDRVIAGDWTGQIRVCSLDGKPLGELTSNPPMLADRLTDSLRALTEAEASLPALRQKLASAEQKKNEEAAAAEAKQKSEEAALAAAKALPGELEQRAAQIQTSIAALQKEKDAAPEADRPAVQQKIDTQKAQAQALQAEHTKAEANLKTLLAASAAAAKPAPSPAVAELAKAVETATATLNKLREQRGATKEGSPEWTAANAKVQAKKADLAQAQTALDAARAKAAPATSLAVAAEAAAQARTELDSAIARVEALRNSVGKWKLAQQFQQWHRARLTLAEKQAQYEGLVQAAKDASQPVDQLQAEIVATQKAIAEGPAALAGKEKLLAEARQAVEPANQGVGKAEALLGDRKRAADSLQAAAAQRVAEEKESLAKQVAQKTEELAKLRAARDAQKESTPERAAADASVQAKKADLAAAQASLDKAKAAPAPPESAELKTALAEASKAAEDLEKARAAAKTAAEKVAAVEKEVAASRAALEGSRKRLAELEAKLPAARQAAVAAKSEAERDAKKAEQELAALRAEADKLRAAYEQAKAAGHSTVATTAG